MKTVQLTLTLDYVTANAVLEFLARQENQSKTPTSPQVTLEDKVPVQVLKPLTEANTVPGKVLSPTAGKVTKMPSFNRSQEKIDAYVQSEANRMEAKDEEAELRAQRAEERAARKAEKDELEAEKALVVKKAQDEVEAIKDAVVETPPAVTLPKKPWAL